MNSSSGAGALAAFALLACGGSTGTGPASGRANLCDGEPGLALAFAVMVTAGVAPEEEVIYRNGYRYLYIDHTCTYWVNLVPKDPGGTFEARLLQSTRTGVMSESDLEDLLTDVRYSEWDQLDGPPPLTYVHDAPLEAMTDGRRAVQCVYGCREEMDGPSLDPARTEALVAARDWVDRLSAMAGSSPVDGPLRVSVSDVTAGWPDYQGSFAEWPLQRPIEDFLGTPEAPRVTLVEPPEATALRELREAAAAPGGLQWWNGGLQLPVRVPGRPELFQLVASDVLPFEEPSGGVAIWQTLATSGP